MPTQSPTSIGLTCIALMLGIKLLSHDQDTALVIIRNEIQSLAAFPEPDRNEAMLRIVDVLSKRELRILRSLQSEILAAA